MIGAILGDIVGSVYERSGFKRADFPLFRADSAYTDDSVTTVAVADCLLHARPYADTLRAYGRRYPNRGYGGMFRAWIASDDAGPYGSFGNGSAMRVSAVGFACEDIDSVMAEAKRSAEVTHDHPEGIKGAQAVAVAVFLARKGAAKAEIRRRITSLFGYDLDRRIADVRRSHVFDVSCQGSVPEAILCFVDSTDVEDAIRLGVSLGGDADTIACMAGAIAHAHYGRLNPAHVAEVKARLAPELWSVAAEFCDRYGVVL